MLFRSDGGEVIAIPQPTHCWLSCQLLRGWGNAHFVTPSPFEEVCFGAEQHDIGWLAWETAPTLDPATGRPHDFREVDAGTHTELWRQGVRFALAFGRYPALLVSLHANTIYESYFDFAKASAEETHIVRVFLAKQHAFQGALTTMLAAEPRYAAAATPAMIERNRLLVAASDRLSLEICWGVTGEARVPNVPTVGETRVDLRLSAPAGDPADLRLDPWPFAAEQIEVICEGHRLRGRFSDQSTMRHALAEPEGRSVIATRLRPR